MTGDEPPPIGGPSSDSRLFDIEAEVVRLSEKLELAASDLGMAEETVRVWEIRNPKPIPGGGTEGRDRMKSWKSRKADVLSASGHDGAEAAVNAVDDQIIVLINEAARTRAATALELQCKLRMVDLRQGIDEADKALENSVAEDLRTISLPRQ